MANCTHAIRALREIAELAAKKPTPKRLNKIRRIAEDAREETIQAGVIPGLRFDRD